MKIRFYKNSAFTLLELSIVLVIMGVLLVPAINFLSLSQKATLSIDSKKHLRIVSNALSSYYKTNNKLPCPATVTLNITDAAAGDEDCGAGEPAVDGAATDNILYGAVPVTELGISFKYFTDAWENKISYYVRKDATTGTMTGTTDIYTHDQNINKDDGGAVFVVISHGEDGRGAYTKAGAQNASTGATANELKNIYTATKVINTSNRLIVSDGGIDDISYSSKGADVVNDILGRNEQGDYFAEDVTIVKNTGNVGIGTSSPDGKLDVRGDVLVQSGLLSTDARPAVGNTTIPGEISGTKASGTSSNSGFLRLSAGGAINGRSKSFIDLSGYSDHAEMHDSIVLGVNGVEKMRIENGGFVGINTNDPDKQLHVQGDIKTNTALISDDIATGYATFSHKDFGTVGNYALAQASGGAVFINRPTGKYMYFREGNATQMTLEPGGNLGMGTANPQTSLHILKADTAGILLDASSSTPSPNLIFRTPETTKTFNIDYSKTEVLRFFTEPSLASGSGTIHMALDSSGRLGINANPDTSQQLYVNGRARLAGNLEVGGFDLHLGDEDQVSNGDCGSCKALSKIGTSKLALNRDIDFTNGTEIYGDVRVKVNKTYGHARFSSQSVDVIGTTHVFRPSVDSQGSLGHPSYYWYNTYTDNIYRTNEYTPSDKRFKENFQDIDSPLERLTKLEGLKYDYKKSYIDSKERHNIFGFIAQEVKKIFPDLVKHSKTDDRYYLTYEKFIPIIVEAIKDLKMINDKRYKDLEKEIEQQNLIIKQQQKDIDELKESIKLLKSKLN